ncbi:MAG TPA: hypothetical protein VI488_06740 [Candidatus Angelobacter sp.]
MSTKLWNWRLWAAFGLSLLALLVYVFFFRETRAVFWPSLALLAAAAVLLVSGLKLVFRDPQTYRGKIAGPILATLSLGVLALFGFVSYSVFKSFPAARNAPKVGQKAPEFTLADINGNPVSLTQLLATPIPDSSVAARAPKGVLVVFYRGYW